MNSLFTKEKAGGDRSRNERTYNDDQPYPVKGNRIKDRENEIWLVCNPALLRNKNRQGHYSSLSDSFNVFIM